MGLAFDAIEPVVYPVAYKLFERGMKRYHVAGKIFKEFGKYYDVPENEINTAMIDLSITCAEKDYEKSKQEDNRNFSLSEVKELIDDFSEKILWFMELDYLDRLPEMPEGTEFELSEEMLRSSGNKNIDTLWELLDKATEVKNRIKIENSYS